MMTLQQLEAELLNSDGPEYEMIQNASTYDDALLVAMEFADEHSLSVSMALVGRLVDKIRAGDV